jgi:hypothetical protein
VQTEKPIRANILEKGIGLTTGDRAATYGEPIVNLTRFAELLSAYFGMQFSAHDAAMTMVLAKISRIPASINHEDNYIDGAVYFAIAGEMAAFGATSNLGSSDKSGQAGKPLDTGKSSTVQTPLNLSGGTLSANPPKPNGPGSALATGVGNAVSAFKAAAGVSK